MQKPAQQKTLNIYLVIPFQNAQFFKSITASKQKIILSDELISTTSSS